MDIGFYCRGISAQLLAANHGRLCGLLHDALMNLLGALFAKERESPTQITKIGNRVLIKTRKSWLAVFAATVGTNLFRKATMSCWVISLIGSSAPPKEFDEFSETFPIKRHRRGRGCGFFSLEPSFEVPA